MTGWLVAMYDDASSGSAPLEMEEESGGVRFEIYQKVGVT
jgi:hypothetical protein